MPLGGECIACRQFVILLQFDITAQHHFFFFFHFTLDFARGGAKRTNSTEIFEGFSGSPRMPLHPLFIALSPEALLILANCQLGSLEGLQVCVPLPACLSLQLVSPPESQGLQFRITVDLHPICIVFRAHRQQSPVTPNGGDAGVESGG